jgi:hypothetical protein
MQTFDLKFNVVYYGMGLLVFGYKCIIIIKKKDQK